MSSSSEDDYCSNTMKKFQFMKDKWVPDVKQRRISDSEVDLSSTMNDAVVEIIELKSEKKKIKKKGKKLPKSIQKDVEPFDIPLEIYQDKTEKKRVTRSTSLRGKIVQESLDLTMITSYFPCASVEKETTPQYTRGSRRRVSNSGRRRTPNRGRRSRSRAGYYVSNYINIDCDSGDESQGQPLFSNHTTTKPVMLNDSVADSENGDSFSESLNVSLDMENEELSIKVHWRSRDYVTFKIRKHQKLTTLFDHFASLESEPIDHILLTLGDRLLRPQDTPALIGYNICQFIEGGVVPHSITNIAQESAIKHGAADLSVDTNQLSIKIQTNTMKSPMEVTIGKDQKMSFAMVKFAEEIEIPIAKLKFYFDGDLLDFNSTPQSLDMEGGECIDVNVQN